MEILFPHHIIDLTRIIQKRQMVFGEFDPEAGSAGEVAALLPDGIEVMRHARLCHHTGDDLAFLAVCRTQARRQDRDAKAACDRLQHQLTLARLEYDLRREADLFCSSS